MLLASQIVALVSGAVVPSLDAVAVLQVVLPVAFVSSPIDVQVNAEAVRLVVDPVALVDVPVNVDELALAVGSVVFPAAFVPSTVGPHLIALAVPKSAHPLALVSSTSLERVQRPLLSLRLRVVPRYFRHRLSGLVDGEILAISLLNIKDVILDTYAFRLFDEGDKLACDVASPVRL